MSEEGSVGLKAAEKFFGLMLLIIGAFAIYYTFTSTQALGVYSAFFGFLNVVIITLGLILIIAKTE